MRVLLLLVVLGLAAPVAAASPPEAGIENPCNDPNVQCHPLLKGIVDWVCANPIEPCT